jgi:ATP-dependent helicase/nuclease subunit A
VRFLRSARPVPARQLGGATVSGMAAYFLGGAAATREQFYAVACHPQRHVVVEACAGAGKTWMLVSRIVRALLDGAEPQDILAITFTRKAAGEMRERLAEWLLAWSQLTPDKAAAELQLRGMDAQEAHARAPELIGLYDRVLASERSVQLRTFHGWFFQLVQAAPMALLQDLGLDSEFNLLEDSTELRPLLMRRLRQRVWDDEALHAAWRALSHRHGRSNLADWLDTAWQRALEIGLADNAGTLAGSVAPASALFAEFAPGEPVLAALRSAAFKQAAQALARTLANSDKALRLKAAEGVAAALATANDAKAHEAFRAALFTKEGMPRKLGEVAGMNEVVAMLERIGAALAQEQASEDHQHMVALSRVLLTEYAALKRERRLVDMNDLEHLAHAMLSDPVLSGWVQERLDQRVRHLLIDEFQDTSPLQWQALHAWLSAYVGAGSDGPRLFIVGDPKQSIYRFRRAEPRVFLAAQAFVQHGLGGTLAACDHTRRCAPGVVAALNTVFASEAADTGLPWREHTTELGEVTAQTPPAVTLLRGANRATKDKDSAVAAEPVWRHSLTAAREEPEVALRAQEAAEVAQAIAQLLQQGVAPDSIFVLARKRASLRLAAQALATLGIAHIASEDLRLADLPPVQDVIAVLDVLASPSQSLSLARFLKSPLVDADDDDLLALAQAAQATQGLPHWCAALLQACPQRPALQRAQLLLQGWQSVADVLPPHDLLQRIADDSDAVERLTAAAPPAQARQVPVAIDALLLAALDLDGGRFVTLYGFVRALRQRRIEAPAGLREGAVQLLTIHGAKGLEAHTVFVMDSQPERQKVERTTVLTDWPVDASAPARLAFVASETNCPPQWRDHLVQEQAARAQEEANALYVAMTRAQTQLVFSRTEPYGKSPGASWWQRAEALGGGEHRLPAGSATPLASAALVTVPAWPASAKRSERPDQPQAADDATASLGRAVHRALEWATQGASHADTATLCNAAARAFGVADARAVQHIIDRILSHPDGAVFFDAARFAWAGNEVPVRGVQGDMLRIDRLVKLATPEPCWWVLDYKLSGQPMADRSLRMQLQGYRQAVQAISDGVPVRCAFIAQDGSVIELKSEGDEP